ncbi:hypothetical protein MGYG_02400 [Nannizzia gypsea CBS 118893]|uniref:Uncharacterized protein n=1 Tax=Arthroderma gypseum (strain ATCC MYA-4604 / CBS 118893) TaxID=535722 RepID=E4URG6_ARTGP|nr:hypothetical protein MGYG_02400 [Nannizzia gypsea CBS 118893]EFQ99388.1 hypothetical protein MGYG_02400 [Nannizzia gypsea CBS 118893]
MPAVAIILIWLCALTLMPLSKAYNIPIDHITRQSSRPSRLTTLSWQGKLPQPSSAALQRRTTIGPRPGPKYTFDEGWFNITTTSTCEDALRGLKSVSNPSGIAACFNVAFLNEETKHANGEFNNTKWEDFDIKLGSLLVEFSGMKRVFQNSTSNSTTDSPRLVRQWRYSGKVNELIPLKKLSLAEHRYLLAPNISITTNSPSQPNTIIETNLTPDTISYTTGYLADDINPPYNMTDSEIKVQLKNILLAALEFEVPGMSLGIFPTGLIVTGIWAGLFLAIVGYGTFERKQYRSFHERRLQYAASTRGYGNRPTVS